MFNNAHAQDQNSSLEWSIKTAKNVFYPGEPVLLILRIKNSGTQKEIVNLGMDGIEAFSFEILDSNNIVVAKGNVIQRFGMSRLGTLAIPVGKIAQKTIVLNQWCSTLLPPGRYRVICNVEYRLRSESRKKEDSKVFKAGPVHKKQLELDTQIIEMDKTKFKEMLEALVAFEVKSETQSKGERLANRDIAREMLAFTESELAVPYQLQLLRVDQYTWRRRDIINSLARSKTLEAATGLMQIIEDPSIYKEDVKPVLIDGVYRLRETGKAEIINATDRFVAKHKRPGWGKPTD
jgi:hypothetical protein